MKKTFLIALLAGSMLASCATAAKVNVNSNKNIMLEDTLAHDEVFGAQSNGFVKPFRLGDDPVEHPDSDSSIGVQWTDDGTYVSFRFVAAVTFTNENIGPTNAVWTRTVSSPDGSSFPKDTGTFECTKAYTKISNGGGAYDITDFNAAQEPDTSYTHFVVYTLRNIPKATYGDYYVCAYLNLSGEGGVNQQTKAIAITVNRSETYVHNAYLGAFFMEGTFNGTPDIIEPTSVRETEGADNKATFEGLSLHKDDSFVIKEFYGTKLYVKGSARFSGNSDYYFADDSGSIKANFDGTYNLFLNKSDEIHTTASNVVRPIYVSLKNVSWWGTGAWTAIYAFNNSTSTSRWYKTSESGDYLVSSAAIDPTVYDQLTVVRMNNSAKEKAENALVWEDKYYNQTEDLTIPHNTVNECVYINNSDGETKTASWGARN